MLALRLLFIPCKSPAEYRPRKTSRKINFLAAGCAWPLIASYVNMLLPKRVAGVMVLLLGYFGSISGLWPFVAGMQIMALQAVLLGEISDKKS